MPFRELLAEDYFLWFPITLLLCCRLLSGDCFWLKMKIGGVCSFWVFWIEDMVEWYSCMVLVLVEVNGGDLWGLFAFQPNQTQNSASLKLPRGLGRLSLCHSNDLWWIPRRIIHELGCARLCLLRGFFRDLGHPRLRVSFWPAHAWSLGSLLCLTPHPFFLFYNRKYHNLY